MERVPEPHKERPLAVSTARRVATRPGTASAGIHRVLDLQRTAGNRAISAFLAAAQPKLAVGAADDPYERQADAVADEVVSLIGSEAPDVSPGTGEALPHRVGPSGLQRRPDPPATEASEAAAAGGGGARGRLQRKVGFEFEDATWRVWAKQPAITGPGEAVSPAARKDKVHNGTGFALEADDTNGATKPSLEFVTVPFDENATGQAALKTALGEIGEITLRLGTKQGKAGPPSGGGFPKPYVATDYVLPIDHQLNGGDFAAGDVLFSEGDSAGKFKMQATMSTDMTQMTKAMTYFGSQIAGETPHSEERRKPARKLMSGKNQPTDAPSKVLGNSPRLGKEVVDEIKRVLRATNSPFRRDLQGDTSAMAAFFAFVMLYVKMLQLPVDGVLKYRIPFLARRSFVTMFQALPVRHQTALRDNTARVMKNAIISVSNANPLIPRTQGQNPDTGLTLGTPLVNALKRPPQNRGREAAQRFPVHDKLGAITIGVWLTEITNGHDLLAPTDCDQWLQANTALSDQDRGEAVELLESFASLDETPPGGTLPPAVFENRLIAPKLAEMNSNELNFFEVADMATQYLQFFVNLAARPNNPGRFPEKKV